MRLTTMLRVVVVLACAIAVNAAALVAVPQLKARVTDLTGTLPAQSVMQLEQRLAAFEKEKGTQVAVLLVPTVKPESIEQYAVRVFEQWRLGRKGVDDGVLLVVAKNDRELRIEVGYGLEGVLTDATSSRIINENIVPYFKRGNFAAGVNAGVDRILRVAGGEPLPAPAAKRSGGSSGLPFAPEWLLIAIFVFLDVFNRVLRAMLGRVAAACLLAGLTGGVLWVVLGSMFWAVIGGLFVFAVTIGSGAGGGLRSGRGGWSSGGGSWSSGSGGGGFSGGGGSSGGGGASGRW